MINFTVGPVQSYECIKKIGAQDVPYFRTSEFSEIMYENERLIKDFAYAPMESKVIFLTGSGTASMEAAVINILSKKDKAIIVNGGSFGHRFTEICNVHQVPFDEIKLDIGHALKAEQLYSFDGSKYSVFIVNLHETSTGVLYNLPMIAEYCKKYKLLLIVDAISSFLADEINMEESGIDVLIAGSQKALGCPPGISLMVLSNKAQRRIEENPTKCYYLDLKNALHNAERGQTPFTPAVGTLLQIHARLSEIQRDGGVMSAIKHCAALAQDFRHRISNLPFEVTSDSLSNAVTPLHPLHASANDIFLTLKDRYGIWVCPNGGELKDKIFRVGHLGNLSINDNIRLIEAFVDMNNRGIL